MKKVKYGDTVKVHYKATLGDGTILTNTRKTEQPLQFTLGAGHVIRDIEKVVLGMNPGESKIATVSGTSIFGPYRKDNIMEVDRNMVDDFRVEIGRRIKIPGQRFSVKILDVSDSKITVDANHPLAEKDLLFDVELIEIVSWVSK